MDITYSLQDLHSVVSRFWDEYGTKRVFAFYGTMGAGKTTFIRELCSYLGVKETVSSPTYALINEYAGEKGLCIYHADFYRLKDWEAARDAGAGEIMNGNALCFIEWPQVLEPELPVDAVQLFFEMVNEDTRKLKVHIHV
jgi:tRNA threonylcarbamoyladenosine biosynthesis protein TsaE